MNSTKESILKEALRTQEGYLAPNSHDLIIVNFQLESIIETTSWEVFEKVNWDYVFVYFPVGNSRGVSTGDLCIFDKEIRMVNIVERNGWKLMLTNQRGNRANFEWHHNFIIVDPNNDFKEKKLIISNNEISVKKAVFNIFAPMTNFKSVGENSLNRKLDTIIEKLDQLLSGSKT